MPKFLDITAPEIVEVSIRSDGTVLWINIDDVCCLRACRIKKLVVEDARVHANVTRQTGNNVLSSRDEEDIGSD